MMRTSPRQDFDLQQRAPSRGTVREVVISDFHEPESTSSSSMSGDSWGGDGMYYNSNLDAMLDQDESTDSSND